MKLSPKEILKPALALLLICMLATALLALTNSVTAARIAETERENAIAARRTVMPDAADFGEEQTYDTLTYCNALDTDGNTVGRVFTAAAKGYGGTVSVMIGIDADGKSPASRSSRTARRRGWAPTRQSLRSRTVSSANPARSPSARPQTTGKTCRRSPPQPLHPKRSQAR